MTTHAWRAPGRVNLIGEHTDYNDGFVLPIALPAGVTARVSRRDDDTLALRSVQQPDEPAYVPVGELAPGTVCGWAAYPAGVVWSLRDAGHQLGGADVTVDGDVPLGAGLSSSAALECSVAAALNDAFSLGLPPERLARLAQRAENDFVGMPCGIMDQMAAMLCTAGHALFLDTRTLATEQVPLDLADAGLTLLVVDTRAPHRLVEGEYAARRRSCEQAAAILGVRALRDVGMADLDDALTRLDDKVMRKRVRHVVRENARVLDTVAQLKAGKVREIGPLLTASHESLRDDYEVSSAELDTAVVALLSEGALGARMTGGGFGGCVIGLVETAAVASAATAVERAFTRRSFGPPVTFTAHASTGAHPVSQWSPAINTGMTRYPRGEREDRGRRNGARR